MRSQSKQQQNNNPKGLKTIHHKALVSPDYDAAKKKKKGKEKQLKTKQTGATF